MLKNSFVRWKYFITSMVRAMILMDSEHVVSGSKGGKNSLTPLTVECCKSLETKTQENVIDSPYGNF